MHWRHLLFCLLILQLPALAAETFCYDAPVETATQQPVVVAGQRIYGQHTARVAGWVLQQLPHASFISLPWQRCLSQVREGRITGLLSIGWTAERAQWFQFPGQNGVPDASQALYDVPYLIFVRKDSKVQWDGQRFLGLQYGLITLKGYIAEQRLRELNALSPLELDINQGVDLLVNRRIDGYVIPPGSTLQQFRKHPAAAQVRQLELPFFTMPLYLAFSPKYCQENPERCQRTWQHLATQRQAYEAAQAGAVSAQ